MVPVLLTAWSLRLPSFGHCSVLHQQVGGNSPGKCSFGPKLGILCYEPDTF